MYVNTHVTVSNQSHQGKEQEKGRNGGKTERKLSEVNTRAVSRVQNEQISKFKMVVGDVISIGDRL